MLRSLLTGLLMFGVVFVLLLSFVLLLASYMPVPDDNPDVDVTWVDVNTEIGDTLRCYMFEERVSLFCEVLTP